MTSSENLQVNFTEEPIKPLIVRPWYFKIKLYFANCVQEAKDIKTSEKSDVKKDNLKQERLNWQIIYVLKIIRLMLKKPK